jgi:opacity protein-like surface antigen
MRGVVKAAVLCGVLALVSAPTSARAEGYVSPFYGVNFGNDQIEKKNTFGVNGGWMGAGVFGAEVDFAYSPNAFDESIDNHVIDLMGNLILGIPVGGTTGGGVRPYVTAGLGLIQSNVSGSGSVADATSNDFGFNAGGGLMLFFADHFGLRGDLRYFRSFNGDDHFGFDQGISLDLGGFDYWRGTVGLVFR